MVVSQSQVEQSLREISVEKHKLENYNDELAKNVASTQALRVVKRQLERNNLILKSRLNQRDREDEVQIEGANVDEMYNIEIAKLKDYLQIIKNKKQSAEFELREAQRDNRSAKDQHDQTEAHVTQLKAQLETERRKADIAAQKYQSLNHEIENLSNVFEFNKQVHDAKLHNLKVRLMREEGVGIRNDEFEEAGRENVGEIDIKSVLGIFRNEYQEILDKAYNQERSELLVEISTLDQKLKELDKITNHQKEKVNYYQKELASLTERHHQLESDCTNLKSRAANESKKFDAKRDELMSNIKKTTKATRKLENQLDYLIREDNEAVKLIIQLQLEINAYKTLMEIENVYDDRQVVVDDRISRMREGSRGAGSYSQNQGQGQYGAVIYQEAVAEI